jgi:uncharacterized protein
MIDVFIIILVSICQSIFGVGVLLFGTPIFLILGYSFTETLVILLPISFFINIMQIYPRLSLINKEMVSKVCLIALPLIFVLLIIVSKFKADISIPMGFILILFSLKSFLPNLNRFFDYAGSLKYIPYIALGLVHGISNLGGSILAILVQENCYDKLVKRTTIAAIYALLATTQIIALSSVGIELEIRYSLIALGLITYFITDRLVFNKVENNQYESAFSVFLFVFGFVLVIT